MLKRYKVLYRGGTAEIVEKKSRFIANVAPVESETEAAAFVESIRKRYWDCRHHCSAFVLGANHEITRCSDDGEPSGTAGRPILDILMGMEIHNACVVVSRYFGGTLLGTGGLVRAYGQAAKAGLEVCSIMDKVPGRKISFCCDYNGLGKIQYIAGNMGLTAIESEYAETVRLSYMVPSEDVGNLQAKVTDATAGRAGVEAGDEVYFAVTPEGIETFDN